MQGLERAIEAARKRVREEDRESFLWAYSAIESAAGDAIFTGTIAAVALAGVELELSEWSYDIAIRATDAAPAFLDAVCAAAPTSATPAPLIALRTSIDDREYALDVDGRTLAKIYVAGRRGDTDIIDTMSRMSAASPITGKPITICGRDIALLDITRNLYTAERAGIWESEYARFRAIVAAGLTSASLRAGGGEAATIVRAAHVTEIVRMFFDAATIIGAGRRERGHERERGHDRGHEHARDHARDRDDTRSADILPAGSILIGDHALAKLHMIDRADRHLQCLSPLPIAEVAKRVERKIGRSVRVVRYWIGAPGDFQLTKHTLYVVREGGQRPILDVYNSPAYEMIPLADMPAKRGGAGHIGHVAATASVQIAGPFVLLRFLIIDLWIVRMIDGADRVFDAIARGIAACLTAIGEVGPAALWPADRDHWRGVYTKEGPARMRMFGMSKSAPQLCGADNN